MIISNYSDIATTQARKNALDILSAGVNSALPEKFMSVHLNYSYPYLTVKGNKFDISKGDLYVIGGGKASGLMALEFEKIVSPEAIKGGIVNSKTSLETKKIVVNRASHPIPDERGAEGVMKMLNLTKNLRPEDTVVCLLSGGGSALLPCPPHSVSLKDLQDLTSMLIRSGAMTYEINIVRKHVSLIKGGQLARHLYPAQVISLIVSDDLEGKEDTASRPTSYDPFTFDEAVAILKKYSLWEKVPKSVQDHLTQGTSGFIKDTVKKNDTVLDKVHNFILADNKIALEAMSTRAHSMGFKPIILHETLTGETKYAAEKMANLFRHYSTIEAQSFAIIYSSETTVKVNGKGLGGRNQEFITYLLEKIHSNRHFVIIALDSDGVDFIEGVAGAIMDNSTQSQVKEKKLNLQKSLSENDSFSVHNSLGTIIQMNPTNTNVGDFHLFLCLKEGNKSI
ncbi:MAG: DUF4147 domain-containing protein [Nanoarchaeota archaeon]